MTLRLVMCALAGAGRVFVLAFALGCAPSGSHGFLSGSWPSGEVEGA